jgi:tyramine---L-glutamate ligase
MRLFLYEYATAQASGVELPASVRREGRAMFAALREDAAALAGVEVVTLKPGEGEAERFREAARRADYALIVAPEFDGILETRCRWVEETACRLLGPSSEGVRWTADKWALQDLWRRAGVATPATWRGEDWSVASGQWSVDKRYLKKHRYGTGSLGVAWFDGSARVGAEELVQEWVPGVVASVGVMVDARGGVHALLPGEQRMAADGSFAYLGGRLPLAEPYGSRLKTLGKKAVECVNALLGGRGARTPPLLGYVGVDAVMGEAADGSGDVVLEINPRVTTSYIGLRRATASNLVGVMLRAVRGEEWEEIVWDRVPVEFSAELEFTL